MDVPFHLLVYLDKNNILKEMKSASVDFLETFSDAIIFKYPPLRYLLTLDVMDLYDKFPTVGSFLVMEPVKFNRICNEILFACLKAVDNCYKQFVQSSQVSVIIRLKSLPRVLSRSSAHRYESLVSFSGLLLAISKPTSYVYHTVWSCLEECEGNEVILRFIPKVPPKCGVCKSLLFENSGLRRCGDQIEATFKVNNVLLCKKMFITDDLIAMLKLGALYIVHVVVLKKTAIVWSLEEHITPPAPLSSSVPADIKELFQACDGVPWKFIYCLASSVGMQVCPLSCFMSVKINFLLSLTSVKAHRYSGSGLLHVLCAGYDTGFVGRLMTEAAHLADNWITLGISNSSVATSLTAASGGVCTMPLPLKLHNQKQINSILSSIETGTISHETSNTTLKCTIWAHGMDVKKTTLNNMGSVFGLTCRGDYGDYADEISDFILEQAVSPSEPNIEEKQALKDVSEYIDLVAGLPVTLSEKTENILQNYFLAARKERPKLVTVASMGALVAVCMTSARLCRRLLTNSEDAVFAIWLHVGGGAEPRLAPDEYLKTPGDIKKLQANIQLFKTWLEQFTGNSIS